MRSFANREDRSDVPAESPRSATPVGRMQMWANADVTVLHSRWLHAKTPVQARNGLVTARHPLAAQAGVDVLIQARTWTCCKSRASQPEGGMRFTSQTGRHHDGMLDQLTLHPADLIQVGGSARSGSRDSHRPHNVDPVRAPRDVSEAALSVIISPHAASRVSGPNSSPYCHAEFPGVRLCQPPENW